MLNHTTYRHNIMKLSSIEAFLGIRGRCVHHVRDVYFVRSVGESPGFSQMIRNMDEKMEREMDAGHLTYVRVSSLPRLGAGEDVTFYSEIYNSLPGNKGISFKGGAISEGMKKEVCRAVILTGEIYAGNNQADSETIRRNLSVKLLFWLDSLLGSWLSGWNESICTKIVADNVVKEQEYVFYLFLTLLGCDVLLIENRGDLNISPELMQYSHKINIGDAGSSVLESYQPCLSRQESENSPQEKKRVVIPEKAKRPKVIIPERMERPKVVMPRRAERHEKDDIPSAIISESGEKSFEELARLASSVVLIAIHGDDGQVIGTGSGIMIGKKGYILTNHHVAAGGRHYSVRVEDDEKVYVTNDVVKYNHVTDLAVIRIDRALNPIPLYGGKKKLVRGQKVVAIGSPLGLFNSVSNGIISGFRKIDDVDMIQFTAPISHGSSGGALLNMNGEVIGISTAGIDSGQNINLAIDYENIRLFTRGFY